MAEPGGSVGIAAVEHRAPAPRSRMGAVVDANGATFRVWAPHANEVWVTGTFNGWQQKATPLAKEDGGVWSTHVEGAKAGDRYKFVIRNGKQTFEKIDPYARMVDRSEKRAVVYDPGAFDWGDDRFRTSPWNELVLYELHVGTFNEPSGDAPGDLQRATEKLDYLQDLGINGIALMPVAEFPGSRSWGYDLSYPFAVERAYGGPDALKRFIKESHSRGMAVIVDVVYNHFGPMGLDMWRFDGWGEGEGGGIYFYNDERAATPWGHTRPNYGMPQVRALIRDNLVMWVEEFHADGFRWDGTVFIRKQGFYKEDPDIPEGWDVIREMNRFVKSNWPEKLLIAEDLQGEEKMTRPVEEGGAGFDSQWDAAFDHRIREAVTPEKDADRNVEEVWKVVEDCYNGRLRDRVVYTESHDATSGQQNRYRVPYEINKEDPGSVESRKRSTLAAGLAFTAPGIPMLLQGQEFLEDEWFDKDKPLDWSKRDRFKGITRMYRDMIALRRNLHGTTRGLLGDHVNVFHKNEPWKLFAFHRWKQGGPGDDTVVVACFTDRSHDGYRIGFPRAGRWRVRFNSDWQGYSQDFEGHPSDDLDAAPKPFDGLPASGEVSIGPYTLIVLSQDPE
ncbi:MAG TPA: alpha-amylase family glycosyl hydrolase [Rhodothermales bacterium]|nr:alpha-amylase family glycosyl hydrolase [Rhodothermales bacterium]